MLLYYAAEECGYVDPDKIETILKVPMQNRDTMTTDLRVRKPKATASISAQATEGSVLQYSFSYICRA